MMLNCEADPKTKEWIKSSLDPTFGFPSLVRFSWTTVKVVLEKDAHDVEWSVSWIVYLLQPTYFDL